MSYNKDVQGHKSAWYFARVENEGELILARADNFLVILVLLGSGMAFMNPTAKKLIVV